MNWSTIAAAAQRGATEAVRELLPEGNLEIVVNIAWRAPNGNELACGSAIPKPLRDGSLLADSLAQSAEEAAIPPTGEENDD